MACFLPVFWLQFKRFTTLEKIISPKIKSLFLSIHLTHQAQVFGSACDTGSLVLFFFLPIPNIDTGHPLLQSLAGRFAPVEWHKSTRHPGPRCKTCAKVYKLESLISFYYTQQIIDQEKLIVNRRFFHLRGPPLLHLGIPYFS